MVSRLTTTTRYRFFVRLYVLAIVAPSAVGAAFGFGGESRFSSDTFRGLRILAEIAVPWVPAHQAWGAIFIGYAMVLTFAIFRPFAVHALRFGIFLFFVVTYGFVSSVIQSPLAGASGVGIYSVVAVFYLLMSDHLSRTGWEE